MPAPTEDTPPGRESRRLRIPTPGELRRPAGRPAGPATPEPELEPPSVVVTPPAPRPLPNPRVAVETPNPNTLRRRLSNPTARPEAPDPTTVPGSAATTSAPGPAPEPAVRDAGPPSAAGATGSDPNPGNLPRRVRKPEPAKARAAEPAPTGRGKSYAGPIPVPGSLRPTRKLRYNSLRARRLPKVEETSAGGVVLDMSTRPARVALIARHDRRSRLLWSLPKGHVEPGETPSEAALREVHEETGLIGRVVAPLGVIDFWFVVEDKRIHKTVHHFVIEAVGGELSDEDVEVEAVEWVPFDQVVRRLAYGDERRLVEKVSQVVPGLR